MMRRTAMNSGGREERVIEMIDDEKKRTVWTLDACALDEMDCNCADNHWQSID
jgi:hypothetical protein